MRTKIIKSIVGIGGIILYNFILPVMLLLLIFLGSIQAKYPSGSNFSTDVNQSFVIAGGATNQFFISLTDVAASSFIKIYNVGLNNLNWFYYFFIVLVALLILTIYRIYFNIKHIGESENDTAQGIIDSVEMKGGRQNIK